MLRTKGTKGEKLTTCAIVSATVYLLWSARNQATFNKKAIPAE